MPHVQIPIIPKTPLETIELPSKPIELEDLTPAMLDALLATGRMSGAVDDFESAYLIDLADVAAGRSQPFPAKAHLASPQSAAEACVRVINAEIETRRVERLNAASDVSRASAAGWHEEAVVLPPPPPAWDRRIYVGGRQIGMAPMETVAGMTGEISIVVLGLAHRDALDALEGALLQQVAEIRRMRKEYE